MPQASLPAPLDAVAGAGLADALRDFLAPAAAAPGTPPPHKDWRHLARYLREDCGFGKRPERWAALLCSRDFRGAWFSEAAPYPPDMRVPLLFRLLWQAQARCDGEKALADFAAGSGSWRLPGGDGRWPHEDPLPAFEAAWHPVTPDADPSVEYEAWIEDFGRAMWYAMEALRDEGLDAQLLAASAAFRSSMFSPGELAGIGPDDSGLDGTFRKRVAGWLRAAGVPGPEASSVAQDAAAALLPTYGGTADLAAAWLDMTASGKAYAERFERAGFESAAGFKDGGDVESSVTFAAVDGLKVAVPRLKALLATLSYRLAQTRARMERFVREVGAERLRRVAELGGELAEPLRKALGLTEIEKSR
jgi:hypothetical protein